MLQVSYCATDYRAIKLLAYDDTVWTMNHPEDDDCLYYSAAES